MNFLLLMLSKAAVCCSCAPILDFKSKEDLKSYSFIGLVTITELAPKDTLNKFMHLRKSGDIKVKVTELFKGKETADFEDQSFNNDCALSLNVGEQWLFFGYGDKKIWVSRCSYTIRYSEANGFRDWYYFSGMSRLALLRQLYQHNSRVYNPIVKYPNGNIEITQNFKNGQLNGIRHIYYPDGSLFIEECFKNGNRHRFRKVYLPSGQLIYYAKYRNAYIKTAVHYIDTADAAGFVRYRINNINNPLFGDPTHSSAYYVNLLDSLKRLSHWEKSIRSTKRFCDKGFSYNGIFRNYEGKIESIQNLNWGKQFYYGINYKADGNIQYTTQYNNLFNKSLEIDFRDDNTIRRFEKECDACRFYFNKTNPAGKPEPVYIQ